MYLSELLRRGPGSRTDDCFGRCAFSYQIISDRENDQYLVKVTGRQIARRQTLDCLESTDKEKHLKRRTAGDVCLSLYLFADIY